jgi:hypothetical protein
MNRYPILAFKLLTHDVHVERRTATTHTCTRRSVNSSRRWCHLFPTPSSTPARASTALVRSSRSSHVLGAHVNDVHSIGGELGAQQLSHALHGRWHGVASRRRVASSHGGVRVLAVVVVVVVFVIVVHARATTNATNATHAFITPRPCESDRRHSSGARRG